MYQPETPGDWGRMQATEHITIGTEAIVMGDGARLFVRKWLTNEAIVLLIVHGLGGHSGWYIDMGNHLAASGITVYALDLRGFGRSSEIRGHTDDYHILVKDVVDVLNEIRQRHPHAAISLLGHSMGAAISAHVIARRGELLSSCIFLNGWIQEAISPGLPTVLSIFSGGIVGSQRYWRTGASTHYMTSNPEAVRLLETDPFWQREVTYSFLVQSLFMRRAIFALAKRIALPTLFLQAEADISVVAAINRKVYEALASRDKAWRSYPGYEHDSQFSQDRSLLDADLVQWLYDHMRTVTTL